MDNLDFYISCLMFHMVWNTLFFLTPSPHLLWLATSLATCPYH